ncbi:MAG: carbonic anhydrase [Bdellovibrionales bacterium CG12_big_fil_rev_8_21_14_0_65_38_15]|nr:MAG: carbonic anhydrase [Bdellovibrionales bacterium CG22_combo_CG10-13_8_21_14_all_38_13]PIQ55206.1 MAG: carbonic anhydrase [Bdellovibrionales bacterium CG12_big_fil_rev_8_21_14_0_65_38_15]PIR28751.1 MAG: carbonic anhydrase [Bdellovibrionales bacterium CG11_big_fil_rev_8_21_14_0_20_38_13]
MKKLLNGILDFRKTKRKEYAQLFSDLSAFQSPDTLLVACSDSRVVPNLFASTDPGDMFVLRNVGNIVPEYGTFRGSVGAAVEFAVNQLQVKDVIVCGHSNCGAVAAIMDDMKFEGDLAAWLGIGAEMKQIKPPKGEWSRLDLASQANAILQIRRLSSYPAIANAIKERGLRLHAWWFNITEAEVLRYDDDKGQFIVLDEEEIPKLLAKL